MLLTLSRTPTPILKPNANLEERKIAMKDHLKTIRTLAQKAFDKDPRLIRARAAEREAKEKAKAAKYAEKQARLQKIAEEEAEAEAAKQAAIQAEKDAAALAKKQREAEKKKMQKERKRLRGLCEEAVVGDAVRGQQMESICGALNLMQLTGFCADIEGAETKAIQSKIDSEAARIEAEEAKEKKALADRLVEQQEAAEAEAEASQPILNHDLDQF